MNSATAVQFSSFCGATRQVVKWGAVAVAARVRDFGAARNVSALAQSYGLIPQASRRPNNEVTPIVQTLWTVRAGTFGERHGLQ